MFKLFGGKKSDHPMADLKEARRILEEVAQGDGFQALDELRSWHESVRAAEDFKHEHKAQLAFLIDEAAQVHLRKLARDYFAAPRLSKVQESRLWTAIHGYWSEAAQAFVALIDAHAEGAGGLKGAIVQLTVRALRALAQQMKWAYMRYGPFDEGIWGVVAKVYALAETRKYARTRVPVYPAVPGDSSPEQEFLRAVMLSASSPDSLLPMEIELAERLIAHFSESFTLVLDQQPDIAYWIDLATSQPPLRLARPPKHAPTLRFFAAGPAIVQLDQLLAKVKSQNAVPSDVNLGGTYEPAMVLDVLNHLALYWSPKPPERRHQRHRVKSRLSVTHGIDGVLSALGVSSSLDFEAAGVDSWIVENVSAGGFGVTVPNVRGEWLKINCLLGLQPEGGDNWVIGLVRRFNRESPQQGSVGIQTLSRYPLNVQLRMQSGEFANSAGTETGIVLDAQALATATEVQLLLRAGVLGEGNTEGLEFDHDGKTFLLLPQGVTDHGDDYELVRFRLMVRDTGE